MAKTATETRRAAAKSARPAAPEKKKTARQPSAYNQFMKAHLKKYRDEHDGMSVKDAMKAVAAMWRDAPENPNRGQDPKSKTKAKPAPKKKAKRGDDTATSEPEAD